MRFVREVCLSGPRKIYSSTVIGFSYPTSSTRIGLRAPSVHSNWQNRKCGTLRKSFIVVKNQMSLNWKWLHWMAECPWKRKKLPISIHEKFVIIISNGFSGKQHIVPFQIWKYESINTLWWIFPAHLNSMVCEWEVSFRKLLWPFPFCAVDEKKRKESTGSYLRHWCWLFRVNCEDSNDIVRNSNDIKFIHSIPFIFQGELNSYGIASESVFDIVQCRQHRSCYTLSRSSLCHIKFRSLWNRPE